ncbi:MAG: hypothetical protein J5588_01520 [Bacteroidales bacterium]|jgi:hypothetical protein|nr:hypothetical protein [Bacteroidales bacterium]
MRKLSAHYIYDGSQFHKLAVLILNDQNSVIALEESQNPYVEHSGVEFFNGVICYDKQKTKDIVLYEHFDFSNFRKCRHSKKTILVQREKLT